MPNIYIPSILSGESLERKRAYTFGSTRWPMDPVGKACMAFSIIWAIVCFLQLILLFQRLRKTSPGTPRKAFISLGVLIFCLMVNYIGESIVNSRALPQWGSIDTRNGISATASFFYYINVAFLPAVCLYLIHIREGILGKAFTPITSQKWKKIFDVVMVGVLYILSLSFLAFSVQNINAINHNQIDHATWIARSWHLLRLTNAITAFKVLVYLDVIVSSIVALVQARKRQIAHAVIKRLALFASPVFLLLAIEAIVANRLLFTIIDPKKTTLTHLIVDGLGRIFIAWVVISTMTIATAEYDDSVQPTTPSMG